MHVIHFVNYMTIGLEEPITAAARPEAWNIFARSNTGIMGSNPSQGMNVCVYFVFVLGNGLVTG
jgi:hypothetical protein